MKEVYFRCQKYLIITIIGDQQWKFLDGRCTDEIYFKAYASLLWWQYLNYAINQPEAYYKLVLVIGLKHTYFSLHNI